VRAKDDFITRVSFVRDATSDDRARKIFVITSPSPKLYLLDTKLPNGVRNGKPVR